MLSSLIPLNMLANCCRKGGTVAVFEFTSYAGDWHLFYGSSNKSDTANILVAINVGRISGVCGCLV